MDQNGTASEYVAFDAIDDDDELLDTPDRDSIAALLHYVRRSGITILKTERQLGRAARLQ